MSLYPVPSRPAIPGVEVPGGDQGAARAVMVAVPVSALVWPVRAGSGGDGRSALLVAGTSPITAGEPVVWCTVVVTAPAVVRRDGRVQAQGRPCDHARLGAAEQELDRRCGPGTIDRIAADVRPTGKSQGGGAAGDERGVHHPRGAADDRDGAPRGAAVSDGGERPHGLAAVAVG